MKPSSPDNGPVLREHTYDGIQEYDQKLPNWWLFTWYITMVWFVIAWVAYYQLHLGESGPEQVDKALANIKAVQLKELEKLTDDKLWEMSQDPKIVSAGAATFATTCVACHGPDLSAKINGVKLPGQPLNDTEWKHGGRPLQLLAIVGLLPKLSDRLLRADVSQHRQRNGPAAALGAGLVVAGMVGEMNVVAFFTGKSSPAQCRSAATGNRPDGAMLLRRKRRSPLEELRDKTAQRPQHSGRSAHGGRC